MSNKLLSADQALRKAQSLAKKGNLDQALLIYRTVLGKFPKNKRAIEGLNLIEKFRTERGNVARNSDPKQNEIDHLIELYYRGQLQEALDRGKVLAAQYPNSPHVFNVLGAVNAGLGRLDLAAASYRRALQLDPNFADAHNNLGAVLIASGKYSEAIASLTWALQLKPNYADAYNNLGNVLKEIGKPEEAVENYTKAAQIKPDAPEVLNNRGAVLIELCRYEEAFTSLANAIRLRPDYAEAHYNFGNVLKALGRSDEAIASYIKALQIKPDFAEAYCNLGVVLVAIGKTDDAIGNLTKALQLRPDYAEAQRSLSLFITHKKGDPRFGQMLEQIDNPAISETDKINLSFALGKAYDDIGDVENAFRHYSEGNRLRKRELGYDIISDRRLFGVIKSIFAEENLPKIRGSQPSDEAAKRPIFIVGMLRSGTTLTEQILASHSQVYGAGEIEAMHEIVLTMLDDIQKDHGGKLNFDVVEKINNFYLSALDKLGIDKQCIVDKMPINFLYIGFIICTIPNARIVNLRRNPAATCWSIFTHYFSGNGNGHAYDLGDVAEFYKLYDDLMDFWSEKFPGQIFNLDYELLTENQKEETQKLLDFCGLDWEDQCLDFHKTEREVITASAAQVRRKMYKGSSEAWRKYEAHIQPMLDMLKE